MVNQAYNLKRRGELDIWPLAMESEIRRVRCNRSCAKICKIPLSITFLKGEVRTLASQKLFPFASRSPSLKKHALSRVEGRG